MSQDQVLCTFVEEMLRSVYSTVYALLPQTVVKLIIDLWYHAQQMFQMILLSATKIFQNMLVLNISNDGFDAETALKKPLKKPPAQC